MVKVIEEVAKITPEIWKVLEQRIKENKYERTTERDVSEIDWTERIRFHKSGGWRGVFLPQGGFPREL
jgi:hypothetical protein